MNAHAPYVLITPAKNEEKLIGETIASVINQTCRPVEWIIVSDGSTDRTNEIIRVAAKRNPWIHLLALPVRPGRNFAAVVHATEAGIRSLSVQNYEYIGLLDSDVRFQEDYFDKLIEQFELSINLGMAGGAVIDLGSPKDRLPDNRIDVPGAAQFFRRQCFEELGGLVAIPEGGWDALTCARVRMLGYESRLVPHLIMDHLKPRNIAEGGILRRYWQFGLRDYSLGYHPLFELVKCLRRCISPPILIGSFSWWAGYCSAALQRRTRHAPMDLLAFVRGEQKQRLRQLFLRSK